MPWVLHPASPTSKCTRHHLHCRRDSNRRTLLVDDVSDVQACAWRLPVDCSALLHLVAQCRCTYGVAEASIFMPTRRTNAQVSASGAVGPMNVRQVSTPPYLWRYKVASSVLPRRRWTRYHLAAHCTCNAVTVLGCVPKWSVGVCLWVRGALPWWHR